MTTTTMILGALIVAGAIWAWSFYNDPQRRTRRSLGRFAGTKIANLQDRVDVRISGTVQVAPDLPTLVSPLTDRQCIAWRLQVDRGYPRKGGGHDWTTVVDQFEVSDFLLTDETGQVHVTAENVQLALRQAAWNRTNADDGLDAKFAELLTQHDVATKATGGQTAQFRYRENHLLVGQTVSVAGSGEWDDLGQGVYRNTARCFRLGPTSKGQVWVSNHEIGAR